MENSAMFKDQEGAARQEGRPVQSRYRRALSRALALARDSEGLRGLERFSYMDYDPSESLSMLEAMGRDRDPAFVIDDDNRFAYLNFVKWCHGDPSMRRVDPLTREVRPGWLGRGIYIGGGTGTGKTWCLELMRAYARACRFAVRYPGEEPSALGWAQVRADALCEAWTQGRGLAWYRELWALCVQDLGQEPQEASYMGNRLDVVRQLVECRGDRRDALTFFTSNLRLGGEALRQRYGDRAASRLMGMCNYFEIRGRDRRAR